ncbi:UNVERIFIED_CONTAM: hypothetical protein RMT77_007105 [Armadillidium vulgare]
MGEVPCYGRGVSGSPNDTFHFPVLTERKEVIREVHNVGPPLHILATAKKNRERRDCRSPLATQSFRGTTEPRVARGGGEDWTLR